MQTLQRLIIFTFLLSACKSKLQDDGKTFNETYVVSDIPGIDSFKTMNQTEKKMEEIFNNEKKDSNDNTKEYDFINNRSRVTRQLHLQGDTLTSQENFSPPCNCSVGHDTLEISMGVGFFGGEGYQVKLYENKFSAEFTVYNDTKDLKSDLSDTALSKEAHVKSKYQYLVFEQEPTFKPGQQLKGYLTMASNHFYELGLYNHLDSTYVTARIFFICSTFSKNIR